MKQQQNIQNNTDHQSAVQNDFKYWRGRFFSVVGIEKRDYAKANNSINGQPMIRRKGRAFVAAVIVFPKIELSQVKKGKCNNRRKFKYNGHHLPEESFPFDKVFRKVN